MIHSKLKSIVSAPLAGAAVLAAFFTFGAMASSVAEEKITLEMIESAQEKWGDGLVKISKTHREGGDAKAVATEMLTTLYDFPKGKVLFKPTLTHGENTFRPSFDGALSYFVGGNDAFPEDSGFALNPFDKHRHDIDSFVVNGNVAIVMGHVYLTDPDGKEIMVDKTFAYRLDDDGNLRIITHHSSLPFNPQS